MATIRQKKEGEISFIYIAGFLCTTKGVRDRKRSCTLRIDGYRFLFLRLVMGVIKGDESNLKVRS